jgi:hypothetical protein
MPIAFLFEARGVSAAEYDGLMERLGRAEVSSPAPDGFIAHLAGPTDGGWRALDVWESEEAAGAFYGSERFQAMLADAPPIDQQPWPLHRVEIDRTMRDLAAT